MANINRLSIQNLDVEIFRKEVNYDSFNGMIYHWNYQNRNYLIEKNKVTIDLYFFYELM